MASCLLVFPDVFKVLTLRKPQRGTLPPAALSMFAPTSPACWSRLRRSLYLRLPVMSDIGASIDPHDLGHGGHSAGVHQE